MKRAPRRPPAPGWRWAVLAPAVLILALGLRSVLAQKTAQHVVLEPLAQPLPHGARPGELAAATAIKADAQGGLLTLSRVERVWRVQRFDAALALRDRVDLPVAVVGELSDLAAMPDGTVWLCGEGGFLWRLDARLYPGRRPAPVRSGLDGLVYLECLGARGLAGLDCRDGVFARLDEHGRVLRQHPLAEAGRARGLVCLPEGAAWLEFDGGAVWVRVIDAEGGTLRRFMVQDMAPAPGDRLAASGSVLIINDQAGPSGLVFYTAQGKPLGQSLGGGTYSVANPGFVAGDPAGGVAYVHFNQGLLKFHLPWPEEL